MEYTLQMKIFLKQYKTKKKCFKQCFKKPNHDPDSHSAWIQPAIPSLTALFSFHIDKCEQLWQ